MIQTSQRLRVSVVGATGYTGAEAIRLLLSHPSADVIHATSERQLGRSLSDSCPWLASDIVLEPFSNSVADADFVLLCQESGFAMAHAEDLLKTSRVIDFSADFRLRDPAVYESWYGSTHTALALLPEAVYSVPELHTSDLTRARLLSNPGCYPTATLLALKPIVDAGLAAGTPVIDAKSGVSGAGRSKHDTDYLFSELSGSFKPYAVTGHRHTPEIEQELGGMCVRFTPHLVPMPRGICSTIHVPVAAGTTAQNVIEVWKSRYDGRPFVRVMESGWPSTKAVFGSNTCILACAVDSRTGYAVLISVIDNLVKGAAGQAIQNMNLMAGLPEHTGLPASAVWP